MRSRIHSVDIARGVIVALSALLSHIPPGGYTYFRHAEWYGITVLDFIFPSFLTLFGVGLGIAYFRRTKWKKVIRRTILLIIIGLLYNAVVYWNVDIDTWRFTGVLQLYAIVGLVAACLLSLHRSWLFPAVIALGISISYGIILAVTGAACPDGFPQPDCNVLGKIDASIFGTQHMYALGERGYDPEGIAVMYSSLANVLLGAAAGRILIINREQNNRTSRSSYRLLILAAALLIATPVFTLFAPIGKRLWTPAYATLTAAVAIALVAIIHRLRDERRSIDRTMTSQSPVIWLFEAFGRNSLLIYFGKYALAALFMNLTITEIERSVSVRDWLLERITNIPGDPQINYALLFFMFWATVAAYLHRRRLYIRV